MGSEQYCLRWNDFQTNITNAFSDIRDEEDFLDVTLVSDGQTIRAHKLVLSACSPMFKAMLKKNTHPQPMIFLHGVRFNDIAAILNFMYHGEVNVNQEDLQTFLAAAEDLRIRGLSAGDKNADKMATPSDERGSKRSLNHLSSPGSPGHLHNSISAKSPHAITSELDLDDDEADEGQPKRKNPKTEPKDLIVTPDLSGVEYHESNSNQQSDPSQQQQQYNHDFGYPYESAATNNTSSSSYPSPQHHHLILTPGGGHMDATKGIAHWTLEDFPDLSQRCPCPFCHKELKNAHSLNVHISRYHSSTNESSIAVTCPVCERTYGNKYSLRSHMHLQHKDQLHLLGSSRRGRKPTFGDQDMTVVKSDR